MGLVTLIPGVRPTGNLTAIEASALGSFAASLGGGAPSANSALVDGVAADELAFGQITISPSVDATEEFRIVTHNASAEFGHTGGGVVSIVTKSGTNEIHGALFEFVRNRDLNANNFFSNRVGTPRSPLTYNDYGLAVGGPVVLPKVYDGHNKTFFFFNWEQFKQRTLSQAFRTVPSDLQKQGNFSQTLTAQGQPITIYDPTTTVPNPATPGSYIRQPFPGNIIPSSRINSVAKAVLAYYPEPNLPGTAFAHANNFFGQGSQPLNKNILGGRVDHYFTPTRRLFTRYTFDTTFSGVANIFGNIAEINTSNINYIRHSAVLGYTDTITPTLLFEGRLGYNDYHTPRVNRSLGFDLSTIGLPGALNSQVQQQIFPYFGLSDVSPIGSSAGDEINKRDSVYSAEGSLTWIHSRHTLKLGGETRFYRGFDNQLVSLDDLTYNFNRSFTQGPNPNVAASNSGYDFASFLLGAPASGDAARSADATYSEHFFGLYVQDDWKLLPRLTLNLGVRWEYESPFTDSYDAISNFNPGEQASVGGIPFRGALQFVGQNGVSSGDRTPQWLQFAPRIGFAFQLSPDTVIRAGYGMFFLPITGITSRLGQTGFAITTNMITSPDGGLTPVNGVMSNPFPQGIALPPGSSEGAATAIGTAVVANPRSLTGGYSQQWMFNVERTLFRNWLLEAGYEGNKGVSLPVTYAFGHLPQQDLALGTKLQQLVPNPYAAVVTSGPLSLSQVTLATLLNTYPQFLSVSGLENWGNSMYHALTVRLERRFSSGISLLAAYSYSKNIDDSLRGSFSAGGSTTVQNWDNLAAERSVSSINLPQRFVLSSSYALPFSKVSNRVVRMLAGGWQLNGILTLQSGDPIAVTQNTPAFGGSRPNAIGNPAPANQSINDWLNLAAFSPAGPFTYGDGPRNLPSTRTDWLKDLDFSILRVFPIRERVQLQFRAEATNLTNTPTFGAPAANISAANFGVITAINTNTAPRQVQFGAKVTF
jgi:hypothetical protein